MPALNRRKIPDDYIKLAKSRNFKWLGPEVFSVMAKTKWRCPKGHEWLAAFSKIQSGRGCPYCAGRARKTEKDYHSLAKEKGYTFLGPFPKTVHIKTNWICKAGHKWKGSYAYLQQGNGCPVCGLIKRSDTQRKKPDDYHKLAKNRGFSWAGPEVKTHKEKTTWRCQSGHTWEACYSDIKQGNGCPACSKSKGEKKIARILSSWKIKFTIQKRFDACKDKNPLPFDFYFQAGNKYFLIEYQGIQHFQAIGYFGGEKGLKELQVRDRIKSEFAKQYKYTLIAIPYTEYGNIREILKNAIESSSGIQVDKIIMSHLLITKSYKFDPSKYTQSSFIDS